MNRRTRTDPANAHPATEGVHLDRADRRALADYLGTLRDAGPELDARLADAFDRLTTRQLDALVLIMTAPDATPEPATGQDRHPAPARRPRLSGMAQVILGATVACLICAGGVLAAGLAFGGQTETAATSPSTSIGTSLTDLGGLGGLDAGDGGF
jgi:hypothetical protein